MNIEQADALIAYLREREWISPNEEPQIRNLKGGVSNRTVLVVFPDGRQWVLKQALEKLRVPVDWFSSPERIHREALGLRWLRQLAPSGSLPAFIFEDFEHHILAMEAVPQPHCNWKELLLQGRIEGDHVAQFGALLGTIHHNAAGRAGEIAPLFADRAFFESLRLEPYYLYAASRVPEAADFLERLVTETRQIALTLTHGDYSPKNILVYEDRLILLDHEVIHFGDPAFDVGFSLTHLLSKAHHLPSLRAEFQAAARHYWGSYRAALAGAGWLAGLEARSVRHTLACLLARVAGRSQLEYMDAETKARQRRIVVEIMTDVPQSVPDVIDCFVARLR